jgi:hypothetical protein
VPAEVTELGILRPWGAPRGDLDLPLAKRDLGSAPTRLQDNGQYDIRDLAQNHNQPRNTRQRAIRTSQVTAPNIFKTDSLSTVCRNQSSLQESHAPRHRNQQINPSLLSPGMGDNGSDGLTQTRLSFNGDEGGKRRISPKIHMSDGQSGTYRNLLREPVQSHDNLGPTFAQNQRMTGRSTDKTLLPPLHVYHQSFNEVSLEGHPSQSKQNTLPMSAPRLSNVLPTRDVLLRGRESSIGERFRSMEQSDSDPRKYLMKRQLSIVRDHTGVKKLRRLKTDLLPLEVIPHGKEVRPYIQKLSSRPRALDRLLVYCSSTDSYISSGTIESGLPNKLAEMRLIEQCLSELVATRLLRATGQSIEVDIELVNNMKGKERAR